MRIVETNNRNALRRARDLSRREFVGEICVGNASITFLTYEAETAMPEMTGAYQR